MFSEFKKSGLNFSGVLVAGVVMTVYIKHEPAIHVFFFLCHNL